MININALNKTNNSQSLLPSFAENTDITGDSFKSLMDSMKEQTSYLANSKSSNEIEIESYSEKNSYSLYSEKNAQSSYSEKNSYSPYSERVKDNRYDKDRQSYEAVESKSYTNENNNVGRRNRKEENNIDGKNVFEKKDVKEFKAGTQNNVSKAPQEDEQINVSEENKKEEVSIKDLLMLLQTASKSASTEEVTDSNEENVDVNMMIEDLEISEELKDSLKSIVEALQNLPQEELADLENHLNNTLSNLEVLNIDAADETSILSKLSEIVMGNTDDKSLDSAFDVLQEKIALLNKNNIAEDINNNEITNAADEIVEDIKELAQTENANMDNQSLNKVIDKIASLIEEAVNSEDIKGQDKLSLAKDILSYIKASLKAEGLSDENLDTANLETLDTAENINIADIIESLEVSEENPMENIKDTAGIKTDEQLKVTVETDGEIKLEVNSEEDMAINNTDDNMLASQDDASLESFTAAVLNSQTVKSENVKTTDVNTENVAVVDTEVENVEELTAMPLQDEEQVKTTSDGKINTAQNDTQKISQQNQPAAQQNQPAAQQKTANPQAEVLKDTVNKAEEIIDEAAMQEAALEDEITTGKEIGEKISKDSAKQVDAASIKDIKKEFKTANVEVTESLRGQAQEKLEAKAQRVQLTDTSKGLSNNNAQKEFFTMQNKAGENFSTNTQDKGNNFNYFLKSSSEANAKYEAAQTKEAAAPYNMKDVRDIERLVRTMQSSVSKGQSKLTVVLTPENLGKLQIQLTETGGKITAKFLSDNEQSHKLIMAQSDMFKNQLSEKGIVVDNMEFAFNDAMSKGQNGDEQGRRTSKHAQKGRNFKEQDNDLEVGTEVANKKASGIYA